MNKSPTNPTAQRARSERRGSRRCKITQLMRIRPSDPSIQHFDDMRGTVSVSRTGVYFHTTESGYEVGIRLFLIMPYSQDPGSTNREYLALFAERPRVNADLKVFVDTLDDHWYGQRPTDQAQYVQCLALYETLSQQG